MTDSKRTVVYYGVGRTLEKKVEEYVRETGIPACLSDRHEEKWHTMYPFQRNGGSSCAREILPLDEVLSHYPDYELWITLSAPDSMLACWRYLLECGVDKDRIKFFGGREYRLCCPYLDHALFISSDMVHSCHQLPPFVKSFPFENEVVSESDVRSKLTELEEWRTKTINLLRRNEKTSCDGCALLQYAIWPTTPKITLLGVGPSFAGGTRCNSNCFYCIERDVIRKKSKQVLSSYDIHKIAAELYDDLEETSLADGEAVLLPHVEELCDLISEKGWKVQVNTNGILYSDKIAETVANNQDSFIEISLDSGTKETYQKIKRVDKFEDVLQNLHQYKKKGCALILKYIMLPGFNDDIKEMDAFVRIAKDLGVKLVVLAQNMGRLVDGKAHDDGMPMSEETFAAFVYLVARLQEEEIIWGTHDECFQPQEVERIKRLHHC